MRTETQEAPCELAELERSLEQSKSLVIGQLAAIGMSHAELLQRIEHLERLNGVRHKPPVQQRHARKKRGVVDKSREVG